MASGVRLNRFGFAVRCSKATALFISTGVVGTAIVGTTIGIGATLIAGCGASDTDSSKQAAQTSKGESGKPVDVPNPLTNPLEGPAAGNPDGDCEVPEEAGLEDSSKPDHVVGTGTKESCTGKGFIDAVALGGVITFDCGPDPVTITLDAPAKVFNDANDKVVIDGGGKITLSGAGQNRILYMNTCDEAQHWTTSHCNDQEFPKLTVQNLTFVDGNATGAAEGGEESGGAIFASGGRFKVINSRFFNNACADVGPDVGGASIRVLSQFEGRPAYVVNTTFGGAEDLGNHGANGGGISSIGVNWRVLNSLFSYNHATGEGGNPAQEGTAGGGSGGGIYMDGGTLELSICGTRIEHNKANAFGAGIIFISNNHQGTLRIKESVIRDNMGDWNVMPGISMHEDTVRDIDEISMIE